MTRILAVILNLARRERPSLVHTFAAGALALTAVILGIPVIVDFVRLGTVPRFPTAILAAAIMTIAVLVLLVGYILESIMHMRREHSRLAHLAYPAPARAPCRATSRPVPPTWRAARAAPPAGTTSPSSTARWIPTSRRRAGRGWA